MEKRMLSWNDRFALIDHFRPSDDQVCSAFGLTQDELNTARDLKAAGTFASNPSLDVAQYAGVFNSTAPVDQIVVPMPTGLGTAVHRVVSKPAPTVDVPRPSTSKQTTTTHTKPETATRRVKEPQKRGRKGDKITTAFAAIPLTQTPVDDFIKKHGVSLAVLRQSKRFLAAMDPAVAKSLGKINVRQDKETKQLMIWREVDQSC